MLELPLQTVETHEPIEVKQLECNPERLSLVFEPEAAATWCKNLKIERVQDIGDITRPLTTDGCFLTVDIGGGTIDVTAHQVERDGRIKVHNLPYGRMCGGNSVNQAFKTFLGKEIVHDEKFCKYLGTNDGYVHNAELLGLIQDRFEETKVDYAGNMLGNDDEAYSVVELPPTFVETYKHQLEQCDCIVGVDYTDSQLQLSEEIMQELFSLCLEQIIRCTDEAIAAIGKGVDIIYLVGGFGGCRYIADKIHSNYGKIRVIIPVDQELAVVRGACLQHKDGVLRTADATYGIGTNVLFDEMNYIHQNGQQMVDADGQRLCCNLFQPYIQIGDSLDPEYVYVTTFTGSASKTTLKVNLYSTFNNNVNYVRDQNGCKPHSLRHLGWLNIEQDVKLPDGNALHWSNRRLEVVLDFSSIEILVHARFVDNDKRVKASVDFLSTLNKIGNL